MIVAEPAERVKHLALTAEPSYPGEGQPFLFNLTGGEELDSDMLPPAFHDIDDTRLILGTTLRYGVFAGKARFFSYSARGFSPAGEENLRSSKAAGALLPTMYDLVLREGEKAAHTARHALCLRKPKDTLQFIHLTDLHVALRNDVYADMLETMLAHPPGHTGTEDLFINFNENLRRFIRHANALADAGELDLVLMLGDLVDFLRNNFGEDETVERNNWHFFLDILLGTGGEKLRRPPNPGIKVPVFTTTGNHDWRLYPYDTALAPSPMRVTPEVAKGLDLYWESTQEDISKKREEVFKRLVEQGTMVSNKTLHGKAVNWALVWLNKAHIQYGVPLSAAAVSDVLSRFLNWAPPDAKSISGVLNLLIANPLVVAVVFWLLIRALIFWVSAYVRRGVMGLVAIEAYPRVLKDYFLEINPHFNYAFRVDNTHFLILDTGHDCLYAQSFWDDGAEKMARVSVKDNILGGSPDTMAFYGPNEYYPYSQITWIERLLDLIHPAGHAGERGTEPPGHEIKPDPVRRVIIGVHSPPANLSVKAYDKAQELAKRKSMGLLLAKWKGPMDAVKRYLRRHNWNEIAYAFNIRYGTINHHLSHFFYLCLGRTEREPNLQKRPPVDMVLAGHAHWCVEFRLDANDKERDIDVYYGDFTSDPGSFSGRLDKLRPLLIQTPGCGPRDAHRAAYPPYFRRIAVEKDGTVTRAEVLRLTPEGTEKPAADDHYPIRSLI